MSVKKEQLFKTAYSPKYQKYVKIVDIRYDKYGMPIVEIEMGEQRLTMREWELTKYVL